jgi:hypothetical protein
MDRTEKFLLAFYLFVLIACAGCVIALRQIDLEVQQRIVLLKAMNERLDKFQEQLRK